MAKFRWLRSPSQAWKTAMWEAAMMKAVEEFLIYMAALIEADMKSNAPWTDRTSNARQSLRAFVYRDGKKVILVAKQQMDYGVFLELKNGSKYAIVMPTLQLAYRPVWNGVKAIIG